MPSCTSPNRPVKLPTGTKLVFRYGGLPLWASLYTCNQHGSFSPVVIMMLCGPPFISLEQPFSIRGEFISLVDTITPPAPAAPTRYRR
jgi:hypothetical protein